MPGAPRRPAGCGPHLIIRCGYFALRNRRINALATERRHGCPSRFTSQLARCTLTKIRAKQRDRDRPLLDVGAVLAQRRERQGAGFPEDRQDRVIAPIKARYAAPNDAPLE